ncbi:hypothetical protein PI126_g8110 [Phytophthora idaei]|nr:hypothetical protein PI126_g8110 [Phytophthora idaei]
MTLCHHPQTVCETPVVPDIIADTEENNEEVRSDDNVETTLEAATDDDGEKEASAGGCGDEVTTRDASEETPCLTKPQWKISTSVKKSGRPKITQAARKKVDCEAMREMNQTTQNYYVRETQQEAYCFGKRHDRVTYANAGRGHYASRYLPESLFNDHETQMPENDVTVIVGRTVFEVPILRAMRKWHTTLDLFSGVETALAWVENDDVWITSLCGRKWFEGACLDRTVTTIIAQCQDTLQDTEILFTMPSNIMRFPVTDPVWLQEQTVWEEMRVAYQTTDLESKSLLYFAIVCFELDLWCAVMINLGTGDGKIYDPQETSDRYAKLQTYLKAELVPLLPPLPSPKRYRFQQHTWMRKQDNYNCGLFIYCFWKRVLHATFRQE